ncbi:Methyltransferase domain-containing protein [Thiohalomonas denitrificans]|uniref:Methyltransferase domain-containing protein n=2 Tax=Thiohalomonas denitrificans TaxID=415747 RepID=A0A1G5QKC0_9GAMM|nr:class I SAM-dependent methyltransferase [Thiohalomonas denitrificans]SCZ62162.1 Methyltransferase domain-containing protein [Thiohalomonas denitrificans]
MSIRARHCSLALLLLAMLSQPLTAQWADNLDVPYVPTPQSVVDEMLSIAGVTEDDVLYDLGSGDGRIVITAAEQFGARAVGIDIDPARIAESRENARVAGVEDRVRFIQQDLFDADIGEATVVTLYLLGSVNDRLRPKLLDELKPGTRVVSHAFDMGDWQPLETRSVGGSTIYLWEVPEKAGQSSERADNRSLPKEPKSGSG